MSNKDFDNFLQDALQDLPKEIAPRKNLFQGVERAIDFEQPAQSKNMTVKLSAIAACFAALLLGVNFFQLSPSVTSEPVATLASMSEDFTTQKNALLVQYQQKPALTDDWQAQLADLEQAESAIKQALAHEPESAALLRMLAQIYRQQLELINRVHQPQYSQI